MTRNFLQPVVLFAFLIACAARVPAAPLTPELQRAIRHSTFEVVLKKAVDDPLTYEKPVPLDLIPYAIRSDAYWSIGTAFAIAPQVYASAAHVLIATFGSQFGAPALRDPEGHIYPIDRILSFSLDGDFVTFSIGGAPEIAPFKTNPQPKVDDPVFAVGNALGEGIVIRDGLLTSETPEEQDGRWKWLRFSAAASPGNSGGPLLDADGEVVGIVRAKSPTENLNYAVPIDLVLKAPASATFDRRYSIKLPTARGSQVATMKASFGLPMRYADFSHRFLEQMVTFTQRDMQQLQSTLTDAPFPKGNATRLLATVYDAELPSFVQQNHNDEWDAISGGDTVTQDLPDHGLVMTGSDLGVSAFRLRRPSTTEAAAFYRNPSVMMDLLLKGLKLSRPVGDQQIRVTSLGKPPSVQTFDDHYGRHWQVTAWPLGYGDSVLLCYALPTPEGYVGFTQVIPTPQVDIVHIYFRLLADALYVNYAGTLPEWQFFLAHPELLSKPLTSVHINYDAHEGFQYHSSRVNMHVPADVLKFSPASEVSLHMAYMANGSDSLWDVGGIYVFADDKHHSYVALDRHIKPRDDSAKQILETWTQMHDRGPGFNEIPGHDEEYREYWIHDAISAPTPGGRGLDPAATILYDLSFETDRASFPVDLEEAERRMVLGTQVLER